LNITDRNMTPMFPNITRNETSSSNMTLPSDLP